MVTTTKISAGPIYKHPDDDRVYYMDFTDELAEDELIVEVTSVDVEDDSGGAVVGEMEVDALSLLPNPIEFTNSQNRTVAIGKAALFRASDGIDGEDYYLQVNIVTDLPSELSRVGIFKVRGR